MEQFEASGTYSYSQMNIKSHTEGLFISFPSTPYIMSAFQQKLERLLKDKKRISEETKETSELGSNKLQTVDLSNKEFNATD